MWAGPCDHVNLYLMIGFVHVLNEKAPALWLRPHHNFPTDISVDTMANRKKENKIPLKLNDVDHIV